MGKPKTQQLITEAKHLLVKGDRYQAYRRLLMIEEPRRLTMKDILDAKRAIEQEYAGGASRKALPPKAAGSA